MDPDLPWPDWRGIEKVLRGEGEVYSVVCMDTFCLALLKIEHRGQKNQTKIVVSPYISHSVIGQGLFSKTQT